MKIGEEMIISEPKQLKTILGDKVLNIKKGDKAVVVKGGIRYLTGEARGKIDLSDKESIEDDYDTLNIAKRLTYVLTRELDQFELKEYLDDIGLTMRDLIETVQHELEYYI